MAVAFSIGFVVTQSACNLSGLNAQQTTTKSAEDPTQSRTTQADGADSDLSEEPPTDPVAITAMHLTGACDHPKIDQTQAEIACALRHQDRPAKKLGDIQWTYRLSNDANQVEVDIEVIDGKEFPDAIFIIFAENREDLDRVIRAIQVEVVLEESTIPIAMNDAKTFGTLVDLIRESPEGCAGLVGGTWINVPGNSFYGTRSFCVQKYLPSDVTKLPTSQPGIAPWVDISQTEATSRCTALGKGYHLITNSEWMTIASNIANLSQNWRDGAVGGGEMSRGHSDSNPNNACPADSDDSKAWVEGDCTGQMRGSLAFNQRRTQYLSNGQVIWDFGGNIWQWTDAYNTNNKPAELNNWIEYPAIGKGSNVWPRSSFIPENAVQPWWSDSWNSAQSIGTIHPGVSGSGGALRRGGMWFDAANAGTFAAAISAWPSYTFFNVGFRCVWR